MLKRLLPAVCFAIPFIAVSALADGPDAPALVKQVVAAAGGEEKLLKLFRVRERLNVSSDPEKKPNERTTIIEPPQHWWAGKKDRVKESKEPAIFLVWGWTLGALVDPESKLETIADVTEADRRLQGLRVSGTITPAMDLYFDAETDLLVRIDWRSDIHRFSGWQEHDGAKYPAKCIGYKKSTGKPWYFTEVLEVTRLDKLPEGLER